MEEVELRIKRMVTESDATVKKRVRVQFAASAGDYVKSQTHASGPDLVRMVEVAVPATTDMLLDVATGGGHVARVFGPLVGTVVIADMTLSMLKEATQFLTSSGLTAVHSVVADAEAMPFKEESFDIATCRIAPHHFPNPDRFVAEIARVLKPGGRFVLVDSTVPGGAFGDFYNRYEKLRDDSHVRSLTQSEWSALIADAGLHLRANEPFRKRHNFAEWTARSRVTADVRVQLEEMMRTAGEEAARVFELQWNGDRLIGFGDEKTLFFAEKEKSVARFR